MSKNAPGVRYAEVERETHETSVRVVLDLDGGSRQDISTGIGFLDRMLALMAFHGCFDLGVKAESDLNANPGKPLLSVCNLQLVDDHHTVEDVGIVIGKAVHEALQDDPVVRYADCHSVMDEALVLIALDISGRGLLSFECEFARERLGDISTECIREFFRAVARNSGISLHIKKLSGINDHHTCEALFKGFGRALHAATRRTERRAKGKNE